MVKYYLNLNKQATGENEIHTESCSFLPEHQNRKFLGEFSSCYDALREARKKYPELDIDGCYYCCKPCHTK